VSTVTKSDGGNPAPEQRDVAVGEQPVDELLDDGLVVAGHAAGVRPPARQAVVDEREDLAGREELATTRSTRAVRSAALTTLWQGLR
jgi:hypothetical protein